MAGFRMTPAEVQEPRSSASPWGQAGPHSLPGPRGLSGEGTRIQRGILRTPQAHSWLLYTLCINIPRHKNLQATRGADGWVVMCSPSRVLCRIQWTSRKPRRDHHRHSEDKTPLWPNCFGKLNTHQITSRPRGHKSYLSCISLRDDGRSFKLSSNQQAILEHGKAHMHSNTSERFHQSWSLRKNE